MRTVTVRAAPNIALVKYWGKREDVGGGFAPNLPLNSSVSLTLHVEDCWTETTIVERPGEGDSLVLNGEAAEVGGRMRAVLGAVRAAHGLEGVHIESANSFPTAAGLASSASGYAALAAGLAEMVGAGRDASAAWARLGSGSATRSVHGGWVRWDRGPAGTDGTGVAQLAGPDHWPELRLAVVVVPGGAAPKSTASRAGMQHSVATSALLAHRVDAGLAEARCREVAAAVAARDFATLAEATMRDSNQFHARCLDSFPPISYMDDASRQIVQACHAFNAGTVRCAYTFDAGPNAVLMAEGADVLEALIQSLPPACVERVIMTTVGPGVQVVRRNQ